MLTFLTDTWKGCKTFVRWCRTFFRWYVAGWRTQPPARDWNERIHRLIDQAMRMTVTFLMFLVTIPIVVLTAWYTRK